MPLTEPSQSWVSAEEHHHALAERDQERQAATAAAWWRRDRVPRVKCGTSWLLTPRRSASRA